MDNIVLTLIGVIAFYIGLFMLVKPLLSKLFGSHQKENHFDKKEIIDHELMARNLELPSCSLFGSKSE